ncbi:aldehyde dehydrogenase [Actinocorallia sp. A-T 12471]|uniref:aldehyde dehydrogenase n=1 Tax=Actinocorallia sp. A-T 12471 TaxID=3089813 RepID=UPI0029D132E6|nr:aldehyde dehydrogenase [Actinocorallia sp. A-T 12471]MDX6741470.1 aldehyde dehydrogenase [Actinocorallia sp. A-T 12471]
MSPLPEGVSPLLINGEVRHTDAAFPSVNPATEQVVGWASDASAADMDQAIAAARTAFDTTGWATDHALRVRCVRQLHAALQRHREELRELTIDEVGAPRSLTRMAQLDMPIDDLAWVADHAENYAWDRDMGESTSMGIRSFRRIHREPIGVVGAITPWNFPHQLNLAKIGAGLAAGNTVVLKPAPDSPLCATALIGLITDETDLPPGVVNIVTGTDHELGAILSRDPRVDMVSFTGSTATGRSVMREASDSLKRVFLELGGKSACIVLDDIGEGLPLACMYTAVAVLTHAGQGCALTTRLIVPRDRYQEAVALVAETMAANPPGDPHDRRTFCGPIISERQRDRVEGYLRLALTEGGDFATGGGRPDRDKGFWIEPTVITGLSNEARTAREEIFGPVLVVIPHDGDDDAVRIANDSPYGLSGAVHGGDVPRARAVAARLRTGTVSVNGGIWFGPDMPFGGYKSSGLGREMGTLGFEEYLETKSVGEAL